MRTLGQQLEVVVELGQHGSLPRVRDARRNDHRTGPTTAATATGATLAFTAANYGNGTYNVSFVDSLNTVVGGGTITIGIFGNSCTADDFQ